MENAIEFTIRLRGGPQSAAEAKRVESAVKGVGGSMKKVGDESERQGKRVGAFGGGLKKMAVGLGAVGVAYGAWNAAKGAITYTTELARSSQVLSKATGMTVGQSSKMVAVSGALGVSNMKLAQVFTKLGSATVKQAEATGKHITGFDRLGISQKEAKAHLNDMSGMVDLVTHKLVTNHIPGVERAKIMTELFGKSWLSLGRLFLEGETNFKHLTGMAKEFGLELGGNTTQAIQKLKDQQEEYNLATAGLKVQFTSLVAGPLGGMLSGFAKLTVYARKGQWSDFNAEVGKIAKSFETLAEKVLPRVAESFAHIAPAVLKAFVKGFISAPIGTQALMAGILLSKMGLTGAVFSGFGKQAGKRMAGGVAGGAVAGKAEVAAAGSSLGMAFGAAFGAVALGYLAGHFVSKLFPNGLFGKPEPKRSAVESALAGGGKGLVVEHGELRPTGSGGGPHAEAGPGRSKRFSAPTGAHGHTGGLTPYTDRHGRTFYLHPGEKLPGAAMGASVMSAGLVEVGERGREVVDLPKGATVSPLAPGSLAPGGDIVIKIAGQTLARINRRELLQSQAAGA